MRTLEVAAWAENKPNVLRLFDKLNMRGVDWALFSGTIARPETSNDVDILVSPTGFDQVAELVPPDSVKRDVFKQVVCGDGERLGMFTDEIVYQLDGTEVQALRPSLLSNPTGDSHYFISLTETAKTARTETIYHGTTIYEADVVDTMLIKSIMQRGGEQLKSDAGDIMTLARKYDWHSDYANQRALEINFDPRADLFLWEHTGQSALKLSGIDMPLVSV
jgi:hypothetical protein